MSNTAPPQEDVWTAILNGPPKGDSFSDFVRRREWYIECYKRVMASGAVGKNKRTALTMLGLPPEEAERELREQYDTLVASGMSEQDAIRLIGDMGAACIVLEETPWLVLFCAVFGLVCSVGFVLVAFLGFPPVQTDSRIVTCICSAIVFLLMAYYFWYHARKHVRAHSTLAKALAVFREVKPLPPLPPV